ncbi:MAG: galactose oxidase [Promethearchaeota archaeon]
MVKRPSNKIIAIIIIFIVVGGSLGIIGIYFFLNNMDNGNSDGLNNIIIWTWVSGNKTTNINGTYGIKGIPDSRNQPGSRTGAISWIDTNDTLWLYGGWGYGESEQEGLLNDLWKFEDGIWTWVSGNKTTNLSGTYGIKGVPDKENHPGGRAYAVSWTDSYDNLWLFGGLSVNETGVEGGYNDLWKYNGVNWTWVSGNKTARVYGVYGTKGVPDTANYPGSRGAAISWIDSDDNFWLFGGIGYSEPENIGYLNDLWKYNGVNWTWMSGNKTIEQFGEYGTKGVPDMANYPGSREDAISWTDSDDNLWLFGGWGYAEPLESDLLNDLWKFDGKNWTWVSGQKTANSISVYGTMGVPDAANYPGSRELSLSWIDSNDNLWLFGGQGCLESVGTTHLNDLWKFDGINWTWISGTKTLESFGNYGTQDLPDITNYPGGRSHAISWTDSDDNHWLFGGWGFSESGSAGRLNDLWKFHLI